VAIREWHTGVHKAIDFTTDKYLDGYNGHVGTLNNIRATRRGAFHAMMADLYKVAR